MKISIKSAVAGASALAIAGTLLVAGGGVANAAPPPFDPALNGATQGTISFFDASGNKITGGALTAPPAYAKADTDTGRSGDTLATLYAATPQQGVNALLWPSEVASAAAAYPATSGVPANLQNQPQALARGGFLWFDALGYPDLFPNVNADPAWQNLYQVRIVTSGPGQAPNTSRYSSATIQVNGSNWQQVYPEPVADATTTTLAASPASPQDAGTPISLTATVSPSGAAGSVQFFDGANSLGSSNVSGGSATLNGVTLPVGARSLTAVFTPTNPGQFAGSTSNTVNYQINPAAAVATTTALSVNPTSGPAFANVALQANVTRTGNGNALPGGAGSVRFFDGGSQIGQAPVTASGAQLSYSNFAPGAHSITAQFVPADAQLFQGSTSAAVSANYDQPACQACIDPQTVQVNVPAGGLSITTPYTPDNPFDLGTMQLNANGIKYNASANFPASGDRLLITDTRAGDLPWVAYVTTTDFTSGGSGIIDGTGLSFTSVTPDYFNNNALNATTKPVLTQDVPSVKGGPHQFAFAAAGAGSVRVQGVLGLEAPSSTPAGLYTATVTFTVS